MSSDLEYHQGFGDESQTGQSWVSGAAGRIQRSLPSWLAGNFQIEC